MCPEVPEGSGMPPQMEAGSAPQLTGEAVCPRLWVSSQHPFQVSSFSLLPPCSAVWDSLVHETARPGLAGGSRYLPRATSPPLPGHPPLSRGQAPPAPGFSEPDLHTLPALLFLTSPFRADFPEQLLRGCVQYPGIILRSASSFWDGPRQRCGAGLCSWDTRAKMRCAGWGLGVTFQLIRDSASLKQTLVFRPVFIRIEV